MPCPMQYMGTEYQQHFPVHLFIPVLQSKLMLAAASLVKGALGQRLDGMDEVRVTTGGASHFIIQVQKLTAEPTCTTRHIIGLDPSQPGAQGTLLRILEAHRGVLENGGVAPGLDEFTAFLPLLHAWAGGRGLYASWRENMYSMWTPWAPLPLHA